MSEFRERFWEVVCELRYVWQLVFAMSVVLLSMLAVAALFVEPGSASYYVTLFAAMTGLPLAVASGYLVRKCS
jgi:hypothetical protein